MKNIALFEIFLSTRLKAPSTNRGDEIDNDVKLFSTGCGDGEISSKGVYYWSHKTVSAFSSSPFRMLISLPRTISSHKDVYLKNGFAKT